MSGNEENLSIGTAFNLQRKFERLHISRDNLSQRSMVKSELPAFGGLGKRTYRELERWDIEEDQSPMVGNRSVADIGDLQIDEDGSCSKSGQENDNHSLRSIKLNHGLLSKASAAVDLISQKIEFKNLMN